MSTTTVESRSGAASGARLAAANCHPSLGQPRPGGRSEVRIDCRAAESADVGRAVRAAAAGDSRIVRLLNVNGQRYIGTGLTDPGLRIEVHGTPGQAIAMFMDGPHVEVYGNVQDGAANTMSSGELIVHGGAGDVLGYGMRGGRCFIRGDIGYRAGIHMKGDSRRRPIIVAGGTARDFLGEYMAGGLLVVLGLGDEAGEPIVGAHVGAGMHGGEIYVRGEVHPWQCWEDVLVARCGCQEAEGLGPVLREYCRAFDLDERMVLGARFTRIVPAGIRPYAGVYVSA